MVRRQLKYILFLLILSGFYASLPGQATDQVTHDKQNIIVENIDREILKSLGKGDYKGSRILADSLERIISKASDLSNLDRANSLYLIGLSYSLSNKEMKSFSYFSRAISFLGKDTCNKLLGKIYYNIGYSYNRINDHVNSAAYFLKSIPFTIKNKGEFSSELVTDYRAYIISSINTRNYEKGIEYANKVLRIAKVYPDSVDWESMADILQNKGVALINLSDHYLGLQNIIQAMQIYNSHPHYVSDNYIIHLGNLASAYMYVGQKEDGYRIYEKAIKAVAGSRSVNSFSLIFNYSLSLADDGYTERGERLVAEAVEKVRKDYPENPNFYFKALSNYADYLRSRSGEAGKALKLYEKCFVYVKDHPWNEELYNQISLGYALSLNDLGKPLLALDSVNSILNHGIKAGGVKVAYNNPGPGELKADRKTLDILKTKFLVLDRIAASSGDSAVLLARAGTAELLVDLIETMRLNLGEEQSRLILGDKYRSAYLDALRSYKACYEKTDNQKYLEKAFEISERSKSASLLKAIRERNAMKAAVPEELMNEERQLEKDISFYELKCAEEKNSESPDSVKLDFWEKNLLSILDKKDALLKTFEKNYPSYTSIKNSRFVVKPSDILKITGGKKEYLSYIIADTALYIFLIDRKGITLKTVKTDPAFLSLINNYRRLMSEPDFSGDARNEFRLFQEYGYKLYSYLIKPVLNNIGSDDLIISTDNLLSYFPFEALVTNSVPKTDLYYSKLPYLMERFRISYVYSATLLSESGKSESSFRNSSVSFAPAYDRPILVDSIFVNRQQSGGSLPDLQYAREEAEFVSGLTSGKLFLNDSATKSNYLAEAGKFDIIHLAMHTVLNGKDPLSSGMIFSAADSANGMYLQPYEVYSVMLKAKMVVLSSCYTGVGTLYAGEGVLSLARGFIFAGSNSVVMSLWEINDRSGTDIMKKFYSYLKMGKSKSEALREARLSYLKGADMLRAHPYFWSTLVIYGDDSHIYKPTYLKYLYAAIVLILLVTGLIYFRKRWYSR